MSGGERVKVVKVEDVETRKELEWCRDVLRCCYGPWRSLLLLPNSQSVVAGGAGPLDSLA